MIEPNSVSGGTSRAALSVTDIIGPIICGPSSSHTAGPCRIGNVVFEMCGRNAPLSVEFTLYNSLAGTGFLHGTQVALLAGVQGIDAGDERLWESPQLAAKNGLQYSFVEIDDAPEMHPNAVIISFCFKRRNVLLHGKLLGESTGGGNFIPTITKDPDSGSKEN